MKKKTLNLIGIAALIISLASDALADWANEKEIDMLIDEKLEERGLKKLPTKSKHAERSNNE